MYLSGFGPRCDDRDVPVLVWPSRGFEVLLRCGGRMVQDYVK